MIWRGPLRFSVEVNGVFPEGCEVLDIRLVDFGAMVLGLELDSSFVG